MNDQAHRLCGGAGGAGAAFSSGRRDTAAAGRRGSASGGAVYNYGDLLTLTPTPFTGDKAVGGAGGAGGQVALTGTGQRGSNTPPARGRRARSANAGTTRPLGVRRQRLGGCGISLAA